MSLLSTASTASTDKRTKKGWTEWQTEHCDLFVCLMVIVSFQIFMSSESLLPKKKWSYNQDRLATSLWAQRSSRLWLAHMIYASLGLYVFKPMNVKVSPLSWRMAGRLLLSQFSCQNYIQIKTQTQIQIQIQTQYKLQARFSWSQQGYLIRRNLNHPP